MREMLGISKKEFHDTNIDLVKRKRLSVELENGKLVGVSTTVIDEGFL